jgi:hypothetical protein
MQSMTFSEEALKADLAKIEAANAEDNRRRTKRVTIAFALGLVVAVVVYFAAKAGEGPSTPMHDTWDSIWTATFGAGAFTMLAAVLIGNWLADRRK